MSTRPAPAARSWREYRVARAVWLYQRWSAAMDARATTAKIRVLGYRLTRWLSVAPRDEAQEYYLRISTLRAAEVTPTRRAARAQLSREAGARIIAMAREAAAADAVFENADVIEDDEAVFDVE